MTRLTVTDARMYWLSSRIPNDQFVLFAFDGAGAISVPDLARRAASVPELTVRLRETVRHLDYPYWIHRAPTASDVRLHAAVGWDETLAILGNLTTVPVDPRRCPWILHVFDGVADVPRCGPLATVAVLQISHASVDGRGASRVARALFSLDPAPPVGRRRERSAVGAAAWGVVRLPVQAMVLARRAREAAAAAQDRVADTEAGRIPPAPVGRQPSPLSRAPGGRRVLRCVVWDRRDLGSTHLTVTVFALVVISVALPRHFVQRGMPVPSDLGAEVTIAIADEIRTTAARNAFHVAGVDLHAGVDDLAARADAIAASLDERRRRVAHPAFGAGDRATEAVPAAIIHRDVRLADLDAMPATVGGHTVVSSVHRGPADLTLSGAPVVLTAGFPALSPVMGLTHGIHGIGDAVTVSIVSSTDAVPDIDAYAATVEAAAHEVRRALG